MSDTVDELTLDVIRVLDEKIAVGGTKNSSYPFKYDVSKEIIKAVSSKVVAHYQPKGYTIRLDESPNNIGVRARLRVTKS
mgnify:CR=1 FL=1